MEQDRLFLSEYNTTIVQTVPPKAVIVAQTIPDAYYLLNCMCFDYGLRFRYQRSKPENEDVGVVSFEGETKFIEIDLAIVAPSQEPRKHARDPNTYVYARDYGIKYLLTGYKQDEDYTYGERLTSPFSQIDKVIEILKENPGSRQTAMTLARPEDLGIADPPCLRLIDVTIVDDYLHLYGYFRSWDLYGAANINLMGLNDLQKHIAHEVGTKVGKISIFCKNGHLYPYAFKFVEDWMTDKDTPINVK